MSNIRKPHSHFRYCQTIQPQLTINFTTWEMTKCDGEAARQWVSTTVWSSISIRYRSCSIPSQAWTKASSTDLELGPIVTVLYMMCFLNPENAGNVADWQDWKKIWVWVSRCLGINRILLLLLRMRDSIQFIVNRMRPSIWLPSIIVA